MNVEKQFFVCLKCIVESVRTGMLGTGGEGGTGGGKGMGRKGKVLV